MSALVRRIRQFRSCEDGVIMAEFMILLPLLLWAVLGLFLYWEAFRTINQAQKMAYSISDLVSRRETVDTTFINGMQPVANFLMTDAPDVRIRITSIRYIAADDKMELLFSKSPMNKVAQLTEADINTPAFRARIPIMANQDSVVVVETGVSYSPGAHGILNQSFGMTDGYFNDFIVTRPRVIRHVCFVGMACPAISS